MSEIRKPAVAGMFYPSDPKELKSTISELLEQAEVKEKFGNVFGIVSPHAGYIYSGLSAAFAYNVLKQKNFKTAIILSPSHREYFPGVSVYNGDAYDTPLGTIGVERNMSRTLAQSSKYIFEGIEGHRAEHAIEVQLPFLQSIKDNLKIVPVVIGDQRKEIIYELANGLNQITDESTVVIASSDLSHFYSKQEADKLDSIVERRIDAFQFEELQDDLEAKHCEACGGGAIVALMKAAKAKNFKKSNVLSRTDSGDVSGDFSSVVGYLSAVIYN